MGRPTKFTPGVADLIIHLIEGGVPRDHAARAAGVAPSTFYAWLARGRNTPDTDPTTQTIAQLRDTAKTRGVDLTGLRLKADIINAIHDHPDPYQEFSERVDQATSRFMAQAIGKMRETGEGDWHMWDRLLERRFPELRTHIRPDDATPTGDELAGTAEDAQDALDRAEEIVVKMLPERTGTTG